ncbi:MAG: TolB family protein, partial [Thermoanaerobaculia bacterium]
RRASLAWLAAVVIAGAAAGLLGYFASERGTAPRQPMRLSIHLAAGQELNVENNGLLVFAPDGESLLMSGRDDGRQTVLRRYLGEPEARPVEGTEGGEAAFFSPDGRWIGFSSGGQLMKVAAEGGRPFPLADSRGAGGATWLADDTLVFAPIYSDGLFRVSAEGGEPERLTTPDRAGGELGHWWPEPLPDGRRIVFTAFRTPVDRSRIGILDLETGAIHWAVEGGFFGRYVPSGHLLYAKGKRLFALPFDPVTARATGPAVAMVDDLLTSHAGGFALTTVSKQGVLAYVTESLGEPPSELVWLDRSGRVELAGSERHRYWSASLSPDGRQAAVTIQQESQDLWIHSLERGTLSRLTSGPGTEYDPVWSSDGRELFYVFDRPPFELRRIPVGSPDAGQPIWSEPSQLDENEPAVAPDGRWLAFVRSEEQTGPNLYLRPLDGSEPARAFRATRAEERFAAFSPDSRWLAYQSDETGRPEIYVEAFPGPGERTQISADGGEEPTWARGSGEIVYRHDDEFRVAATRLGDRFEFEPPRTLFSLSTFHGTDRDARSYDVTSDGTRILAVRVPEAERPRQIEIVTDWTRELARLAPSRER